MIDKLEVYGIITAAGFGTRMKTDVSKQFLQIGKMTVLERTLRKFIGSKYIDEIIIVAREENFTFIKEEILAKYKSDKISLVKGGSSREESTLCGINSISNPNSIVITHDSARPFIKTDFIDKMIEEVRIKGAVISCVAEVDTIKEVIDNEVISTRDRTRLHRVQTPQGFTYGLIKQAMDKFKGVDGLTDDSSFVEKNGGRVFVLQGSYDNIKITNNEDLKLANILAKEEDDENW